MRFRNMFVILAGLAFGAGQAFASTSYHCEPDQSQGPRPTAAADIYLNVSRADHLQMVVSNFSLWDETGEILAKPSSVVTYSPYFQDDSVLSTINNPDWITLIALNQESLQGKVVAQNIVFYMKCSHSAF